MPAHLSAPRMVRRDDEPDRPLTRVPEFSQADTRKILGQAKSTLATMARYLDEVSAHRGGRDRLYLTTAVTELNVLLGRLRHLAIVYGVKAEELP